MNDYDFLDGITPDPKFNTFVPAKTFDQLGILVLDGSGSMSEPSVGLKQLAELVERAVSEFIEWFQTYSTIRNNISLAIVTFDDIAKIQTPTTPITDVDSTARYNPLDEHGNGTEIANGLIEAHKLAIEHLNHPNAQKIPHTVKIILMSDGLTNNSDLAIQKAKEIKSDPRIEICSTYFENPHPTAAKYADEAVEILQEIATSKDHYKDTHDPEGLRRFFISSLSAQQKFPEEEEEEDDSSNGIFDKN